MPLKSQADAAAAEEEEEEKEEEKEEKEEEKEEEEGDVLISISQIHPRCSSCHSTKFWLQIYRPFDWRSASQLRPTLKFHLEYRYLANIVPAKYWHRGKEGDAEMGLFLRPKYFLFLDLKK